MRRLGLLLAVAVAGCTTGGASAAPAPAPAPANTTTARSDAPWPVKTRYVIDLWLHGYAMLQNDTTLVPFFKRDYRDAMVVVKNKANVQTLLDVNADKLRARLRATPSLINGQFLAIYEGTWEEMRNDINVFLRADGNPRNARDAATQTMIATFAQAFTNQGDRDWLRLFAQALDDEHQRYYQSWWTQRQRELQPVLKAVDSLWTTQATPTLRGFLENTQQANGSLFLSIPLDGEGRTIQAGSRSNAITVTFPESEGRAVDAIYVAVHEMVGALATQVVSDNTTPAEKRAGLADRYQSAAAVRTGALLLKRAMPALLTGYERYYLEATGVTSITDADGQFARTFPLPATMLDGLTRQLDIVLGGI